MTTQTEALKLALEALEALVFNKPFNRRFGETIAEIKEALAQPEQGPVVGTKTWFEDGKVVTQHLTAKDIYKEPEQEPVAWMKDCADFWDYYRCLNETAQEKYDQDAQLWIKTLRTTPPQRTWVGLTPDEMLQCNLDEEGIMISREQAKRNVEAKLKEKNA